MVNGNAFKLRHTDRETGTLLGNAVCDFKASARRHATTEFVSQSRMLYVRSCGRGRGILEDAVRIGESLLSQLVFFS